MWGLLYRIIVFQPHTLVYECALSGMWVLKNGGNTGKCSHSALVCKMHMLLCYLHALPSRIVYGSHLFFNNLSSKSELILVSQFTDLTKGSANVTSLAPLTTKLYIGQSSI